MVITNQGVAIQPGFSSKTTCSFKNRPIGCVYKTGAKYASKDEIGRSQSLPRSPDRGTVLRVRGRGTGPHTLARSIACRRILPRSHHDLRRTQQAHNKEKEIKILSLSSNREQLRYRDRSNNIFERFSNGTAENILEMA